MCVAALMSMSHADRRRYQRNIKALRTRVEELETAVGEFLDAPDDDARLRAEFTLAGVGQSGEARKRLAARGGPGGSVW